jgi:acyl-CoA thioesterase FadM
MVTARLEIDYRRPIGLDVEYTGEARIEAREGRKVWCTGELLDEKGTVMAQARGLFLRVGPEHFLRASPEAAAAIERWRNAGREGDAGPGPVAP